MIKFQAYRPDFTSLGYQLAQSPADAAHIWAEKLRDQTPLTIHIRGPLVEFGRNTWIFRIYCDHNRTTVIQLDDDTEGHA